MHNKVKDKVCPVNTTEYIGCRGIAPLSLNPSLEGGGRVNFELRPLCRREKIPGPTE